MHWGCGSSAIPTGRSTIEHARQSGHFFTLSAVLVQAAFVELLCRNAVVGGNMADQSASLAAEHGLVFPNAVASLLAGWALVQQGQAPEAIASIERAMSAMRGTGTRYCSAFAYAFLAEARLQMGALADGLVAVDAGLAVAHTTLDRAYEPELWRLKGELLLRVDGGESQHDRSQIKTRRGKVGHGISDASTQAVVCFRRALELSRAAKAKSLELRAATSLARLWQAGGRRADARKLLGGVCKWFGARTVSADLIEARALLGRLTDTR